MRFASRGAVQPAWILARARRGVLAAQVRNDGLDPSLCESGGERVHGAHVGSQAVQTEGRDPCGLGGRAVGRHAAAQPAQNRASPHAHLEGLGVILQDWDRHPRPQ